MALITTPGWYLLGFVGLSTSINDQLTVGGVLDGALLLKSAYAILPTIEINRLLTLGAVLTTHLEGPDPAGQGQVQINGAQLLSPEHTGETHWTLDDMGTQVIPVRVLLQDPFGLPEHPPHLLYVKIGNLDALLDAPIGLWCYIAAA